MDRSLRLVKQTYSSLQEGNDDDDQALLEYYYTVSDCVVALKHNTRQTLRRLPCKFHIRWAEHYFKIRRHKEPSLTCLESRLQERILAQKEAYLPPKHDPKKRGNTGSDMKWFGKTTYFEPASFMKG